jgi:hypothetical protein
MTRNDIRILYFTVLGLTAVVVFLRLINQIDTAQGISLIVTSILVLVTACYVRRTGEIAEATKKQTEASRQMAEEMRAQRIVASRPIIVIKAVQKMDILEGSTKDYFSYFAISSVGNTPAIEVEISLTDKDEKSLTESVRQTYLRSDDPPIKFRPYNIAGLEEDKDYHIVCEFQDVFSNYPRKTFCKTHLPFKISKSSKEGEIIVIAGELEFLDIPEKDRIDAFGSRSKPQ